MNERNPGETGPEQPEQIEREPVQQTLREIARQLGFIETVELQEVERQAVDASKTPDSPENVEKFTNLVAQIQFLGEPITEHETPKIGLAQIGLMAVRAATLFESNHLRDCQDEIYDILTALGYMIEEFQELIPIFQKLEELYQILQEA